MNGRTGQMTKRPPKKNDPLGVRIIPPKGEELTLIFPLLPNGTVSHQTADGAVVLLGNPSDKGATLLLAGNSPGGKIVSVKETVVGLLVDIEVEESVARMLAIPRPLLKIVVVEKEKKASKKC